MGQTDSKALMRETKMQLIGIIDDNRTIIKKQNAEIADLKTRLQDASSKRLALYDEVCQKLNVATEKVEELQKQNDALEETNKVLEDGHDTLRKNYIALRKEREADEATVVKYEKELVAAKKENAELTAFKKTIVDDNNQLYAKIDDEKKIEFIMAITIVILVILCIIFAIF